MGIDFSCVMSWVYYLLQVNEHSQIPRACMKRAPDKREHAAVIRGNLVLLLKHFPTDHIGGSLVTIRLHSSLPRLLTATISSTLRTAWHCMAFEVQGLELIP